MPTHTARTRATPALRPTVASNGGETLRVALAELDALLEYAATIEPDDVEPLRAEARRVLARLVAAKQLPPSLTLASDDPPVVVPRLLAQATRRTVRTRKNGEISGQFR